MKNRIKNFIGLPEKRIPNEKEWEIIILRTGSYYISMPFRFFQRRKNINFNKEANNISSWSSMRVKIISAINRSCVNSHFYMRLHTFTPDNLLTQDDLCQFEKIPIKDKKMNLFYIQDCSNERVWEIFFEAMIVEQEGKIFFALKYRPDNWKEIIEQYYRIVCDTFNLRKSINAYRTELEQCCLLCYSILDDSALIIAKTELSETIILSIIDSIAREEDLELKITRKE